jgi:hypothetical protein
VEYFASRPATEFHPTEIQLIGPRYLRVPVLRTQKADAEFASTFKSVTRRVLLVLRDSCFRAVAAAGVIVLKKCERGQMQPRNSLAYLFWISFILIGEKRFFDTFARGEGSPSKKG